MPNSHSRAASVVAGTLSKRRVVPVSESLFSIRNCYLSAPACKMTRNGSTLQHPTDNTQQN